MRKIEKMLIATIVACSMTACSNDSIDNPIVPDDDIVPTAKEKAMVQEPMIWMLDSIQIIYDYQTPNETYEMLYAGYDIDGKSYRFYPSTYQFPEDLVFYDFVDDNAIQVSKQFNKDFCKYVCISAANEEIVSAGYLCYYGDMFTLNGIRRGGIVDHSMFEADTSWDSDVWTCSYNALQEDDGIVKIRHIEYYTRVYPRE